MTTTPPASAVPDGPDAAQQFWEAHYQRNAGPWGGIPNETVAAIAHSLTPGRALDLGCANGGDATWLGLQGWTAVGVDVSQTAVETARTTAAAAGVGDRVTFERHDLAESLPSGDFDLVTASFLQTPVEFDRPAALRRVAEQIPPGGHLLVIDHASVAPWSWNQDENAFSSAQETLDTIGLASSLWEPVIVEARDRLASGPGGQTAIVTDNVILVRKRAKHEEVKPGYRES